MADRCAAHGAHRARDPRPQGPRRRRAARDGHRLRRARRPHGRRGRRRPDPRRRLASPWSCSATTTPCRSPSTTSPTTPRAVGPGQARAPLVVGDLPWMSYHVSRRGHRPQRRHADPGRRPGGEARGRPQAAADDRGHRRRRDPGDGPPRPHPAVGPRHGRVQGAGPRAPSAALDAGRRRQGAGRTPAASPSCSRACPTRSPAWSPTPSTCPTIGIGAGPRLRRPGARVPRRARHRGPHRCRSSCAATPTEGRRRSPAWRPTPPTCAPARFPADAESYHLTAEVAETLGLYGAGADRRLSRVDRGPAPCAVRSGAAVGAACCVGLGLVVASSVRATAPTARPTPALGRPRAGATPPAERRRATRPRRRSPGFDEVADHGRAGDGGDAARVVPARCAAPPSSAAAGLMEVTDLRRLRRDGCSSTTRTSTSGFYMRNTPMPLSIAWFDADGAVVSTADMAPCDDRDGCPLYPAAGPYRLRHRGARRAASTTSASPTAPRVTRSAAAARLTPA